MLKITAMLTVYFDDPFWVGVLEKIIDGQLFVNRVTFGSEPKDYELYDFYNAHQYSLRFGKPVEYGANEKKNINPKRMQREISRHLKKNGVSTKSQDALRIMVEESKVSAKKEHSQKRQEEKKQKYELKRNKKKQKKRGR